MISFSFTPSLRYIEGFHHRGLDLSPPPLYTTTTKPKTFDFLQFLDLFPKSCSFHIIETHVIPFHRSMSPFVIVTEHPAKQANSRNQIVFQQFAEERKTHRRGKRCMRREESRRAGARPLAVRGQNRKTASIQSKKKRKSMLINPRCKNAKSAFRFLSRPLREIIAPVAKEASNRIQETSSRIENPFNSPTLLSPLRPTRRQPSQEAPT